MEGKISFGFKKAVPGIGGSTTSAVASTSKLPGKPSLFDNDDDDDDTSSSKVLEPSDSKKKKGSILNGVAGAAPLSRSAKARTEEALNVDASVFDYDGVYDSMKVGEREAMARREEEKKKRDPKYISAFLESSQQRKVDRTRAEAKMIQREREAEGEEFKDTEMFVTDAYKEQMEEIRKAEIQEKQREEKERSKSKGVAAFYKNFMEKNDRAHQAAVTASLQAKTLDGKEPAADQVEKEEDGNQLRAVEEARKKGLNVRLNDDNEVVDERSLLSAGLNTFGKKKNKAADAEDRRDERGHRAEQGTVKRDGAREAREAREAQRQRQSKMIEDQMLELEKKREEETRVEQEEKRKTLVKERRNDQSSVESARERALERKRKREQQSTSTASV
jgi:coiled-coil domain-containing protein 55